MFYFLLLGTHASIFGLVVEYGTYWSGVPVRLLLSFIIQLYFGRLGSFSKKNKYYSRLYELLLEDKL